jgi:predicted component of viral defense system (DUF524 family)
VSIDRLGGWRLHDGKIHFPLPEGEAVCLSLAGHERAFSVCDNPRLAPIFFAEWQEILGEAPERAQISFGSQTAEKMTTILHRYTYRNQVGRSRIRVILADGRALPLLEVAVLSPKYPTPGAYLAFFERLLADLTARSVQFPFYVAAPTGWPAAESPRPPTPLFVYHFLRQHADLLCAAVETVLGVPHRALCEEESVVPLPQATAVGADVIDWMLGHPEEWARAPHLPVARRLRGYAPARVWQRLVTETFDTLPNRFVRHFLRELGEALDDLLARIRAEREGWNRVPAEAKQTLTGLHGALTAARLDPLFDEVGELDRFPASSTVLLGHDGYRDLLDLWRQFHLARAPLFDRLAAAVDARDVATLYEIWCFFALAAQIGQSWDIAPRFDFGLDEVGGLAWQTAATFAGRDERLVYNKSFGRGRGSYSLPLRPDFCLMRGERALTVFDAKFRFDRQDVAALAEATDDDYEQAVVAGDAQRLAKRADLYKMHTYRDALGCAAAVALYPGDRDAFYRIDGERQEAVDWAALLAGAWWGVGAVAMAPEARTPERDLAR